MNIDGEVVARPLLPDCEYHAHFESQCGLRGERSTTDMIFTVHYPATGKVTRTELAALSSL